MRDELQFLGSKRDYRNARHGEIIETLRRLQVSNPVLLLDEVDKIGATDQCDPSAALLEVLDTEHNHAFREHYPVPPGASSDEVAALEVLQPTVGNLTLLTGSLNPSIPNGPWCSKREEILKFSALPLNRDLGPEGQWSEERIRARADRLLEVAKKVWPGLPSNASH